MGEEKTLGQVAFEAYNDAKGGLTYDGKPIPSWDTLTDEVGLSVRAAWEAAAVAATSADIERASLESCINLAQRKLGGPRSREAGLVRTKLDEAEMWACRIPLQSLPG